MGKRHHNSNDYVIIDDEKREREVNYKKHKRSKRHKHYESESPESDIEIRAETKKHKHKKRRKHSHHKHPQESQSDSEDEQRKKREKHLRRRHKAEPSRSKWEDDPNIKIEIKSELSSEDERIRRTNENHREPIRMENFGVTEEAPPPQSNNVQVEENKDKVNFGLSGKLTEDANMYNGIVIKYAQPPEARKPKRRWRWYIFKGDEELPFLPLHRQSAYLIGRERKVADIPTDHPSCSKQHAVFQYRLVAYDRPDGSKGRTVKPYILDLESANGTYVNNKRIDPRRYVELIERDVVKFGYSSREYVLLHEASKGSDMDEADTGAVNNELSPISLLRSTSTSGF